MDNRQLLRLAHLRDLLFQISCWSNAGPVVVTQVGVKQVCIIFKPQYHSKPQGGKQEMHTEQGAELGCESTKHWNNCLETDKTGKARIA